MSEVLAPAPVPATPAVDSVPAHVPIVAPEPVVAPTPVVQEAPVAPLPGEACPTCGKKSHGPSVFRRVLRGARVLLHDPAVDRSGKALASILVVRVLVAAGATDALVQQVQSVLRTFGI